MPFDLEPSTIAPSRYAEGAKGAYGSCYSSRLFPLPKKNKTLTNCVFPIAFVQRFLLFIPIGSMGLVYLPTFSIRINHSWIGKYTIPMDPMGYTPLSPVGPSTPLTSKSRSVWGGMDPPAPSRHQKTV